jgi:hypothetical protein
MKEQEYTLIGWLLFAITIVVAFVWCINESGLAGFLIRNGQKLLHVRLVQISWLITFVVICLPGFVIKRYFDGLAWNAHLRALPQPDIRESAKKSKYINLESAPPPAPKPVEIHELPKDQEEFIATCSACGHYFSARKTSDALKCPHCGEVISIGA